MLIQGSKGGSSGEARPGKWRSNGRLVPWRPRNPPSSRRASAFNPTDRTRRTSGPGPAYSFAAKLARAGPHPRLCIIATAVGDDPTWLAAMHHAFSKLDMVVSHLNLFPMPNFDDIEGHLSRQDIIWVSGGSTANLLALWRLHGLDEVLRGAWQAGVVLMGVSAGSLCWHIGGTTDSYGLPCSR